MLDSKFEQGDSEDEVHSKDVNNRSQIDKNPHNKTLKMDDSRPVSSTPVLAVAIRHKGRDVVNFNSKAGMKNTAKFRPFMKYAATQTVKSFVDNEVEIAE